MPENEFPKLKLHPFQTRVRGGDAGGPSGPSVGAGNGASGPPAYAELCVTSNYTFLTGASHPEEYVSRAVSLGYRAVAITDTNTVAGVVRAHVAAKDAGVRFVLGCRLRLMDVPGASVFVYPTDMASYGRLCRLLTVGKRRAAKGQCHLWLEDVAGHREGLVAIVEFDGAPPTGDSSTGGSSWTGGGSSPGPDSPPGGRTSVARGFSPWTGQEKPGTPEGCARAADLIQVDDREEGIEAARHQGIESERGHATVSGVVPRFADPSGVDGSKEPPPGAEAPGNSRVPLRGEEAHARASCGRATPSGHRGIECEDLLHRLLVIFDDDRLSLALRPTYAAERCEPDNAAMARIADLSRRTGVPLVATNGVHYHDASRRMLQDVLTCIRHTCTLEQAGFRLHAGAERHLKAPDEMHRLLAAYPGAIERALSIVDRTRGFTLDDLRYEYPDEVVPQGVTPQEHLAALTWKGAAERYPPSRYPGGVPEKVCKQIEHELALIDELGYARYFLTVHDLVRFAREEAGDAPILCQGRGAAANSAVCYCLGVTSVDPSRIDVLFERFVSRERNEPPDIDIDFEHERREEVIQYIYKKYGRDRAALTAEVISYRRRSAVRDVGKALGLSLDTVDRLAKDIEWFDGGGLKPARLREMGLNPDDPTMRWLARLSSEILGFPRHLSQHVGGFVITRRALCELVPVENAAMPDRTVIEWDKDDIDAMGMLKVDCLGLGMLTCIRRALDFVNGEGVEVSRCRGVGKESVGEESVEQEEAIGRDGVARPRAARACALSPRSGARVLPGASAPGGGSFDPSTPEGSASRGITPSADGVLASHSMPRCRAASMPSPPSSTSMNSEALAHPSGVPDCSGSFQGLKPLATVVRPPGEEPGEEPGEANTPTSSLPTLRHPDPSAPLPLGPSAPSDLQLHTIPPEDPSVYEMICNADTVGVFQIESRAQMSMLPRLRPVCFYDLVIEVAIVRPGPIQGDMVHPYLRRRSGQEDVPENAHPAFKEVLGKTLGVPLFQEQCMALAVKAAGFTPGEADQLRRAMAAWKRKGDQIVRFGMKMIEGMVERGIPREFAERCFEQVKGFSSYGFPESHAASFALLVYASAWLKRHHPAEFAAALINSQPMGFYAPAQIIRDAKEHGVAVRPIDVNASGWDCRMEAGSDGATERRSDGGGRKDAGGPGCRGAKRAEMRSAKWSDSLPGGRTDVARGFSPWEGPEGPGTPEGCARASESMGIDDGAEGIEAARHRGIESESELVSASCDASRFADPSGVEATRESPPGAEAPGNTRAPSGRPEVGQSPRANNPLRRCVAASLRRSPSIRLGMRLIAGLRQDEADMIAGAVARHGPFDSMLDLWRASGVRAATMRRLAAADAFGSMGLSRQEALWHARLLRDDRLPLFEGHESLESDRPDLPDLGGQAHVVHDYNTTGLSLKQHPVWFAREHLTRLGATPCEALLDPARTPEGSMVSVAGLVLNRQRPGTASGVTFMTLEDETGIANLVVWKQVYDRYRRQAGARLLLARGTVQREGKVVHVVVRRMRREDAALDGMTARSRDFR